MADNKIKIPDFEIYRDDIGDAYSQYKPEPTDFLETIPSFQKIRDEFQQDSLFIEPETKTKYTIGKGLNSENKIKTGHIHSGFDEINTRELTTGNLESIDGDYVSSIEFVIHANMTLASLQNMSMNYDIDVKPSFLFLRDIRAQYLSASKSIHGQLMKLHYTNRSEQTIRHLTDQRQNQQNKKGFLGFGKKQEQQIPQNTYDY